MVVKALVIGVYFALLITIGLLAKRRARKGSEDFFLASRSLSPGLLFLTMAATNFSAFTVFGFSGAGWRIGYAFYPIMAFGTGFMALMYLVLGRPVWRLGREKGLVTPPELVLDLLGSRSLRYLVLAVMVAFTLPYLAMQPMAAGYALEELLGLPYAIGAAAMTLIMLGYVLLGGLRGEAWADALQGVLMLVFLSVALGVVAGQHGGLTAANRAAAEAFPAHFSRPGAGGAFPPGIWFGYLLLWLFCDPMFPQLFQRFYAARSGRALSWTATLYPLVTGGLFLLPVAIGVIGRLSFPTLEAGTSSDRILPLLMGQAPGAVEALVAVAGLAALMSTLDSQLLSVSSMVSRDVVEPLLARRGRTAVGGAWTTKGIVALLAGAGLLIALRPSQTFLGIATEAFTGLAVLFPTFLAALYWRRTTPAGAIASILVGEGLVAGYHFGLLPRFGTLPVVPIVTGAALVLVGVSLLTRRSREARTVPFRVRPLGLLAAAACLGLFVLANDVWAWGDARLGPLGFPWWVWYSLGLCVLTSVLFGAIGRWLDRKEGGAVPRDGSGSLGA